MGKDPIWKLLARSLATFLRFHHRPTEYEIKSNNGLSEADDFTCFGRKKMLVRANDSLIVDRQLQVGRRR